MQFAQPFDATRVEPSSFAPPPPMADYHVAIVDSEGKPTSDQTGGYLELTLDILDPGPYLNRKVPYRLNLFNKNQQTVEIAYRQLSAVCHATGQFNIQDSRQLHGIPFIATIGPQKDNPQYSNVFGVKDVNGNTPGQRSQPAAAAAPMAPAAPAPPAQAAQPAAPAWAQPAAPAAPAQPAAPAWAPPGAPAAPAAPAASAPWAQPAAPPAAPAAPGVPAWQPAAPSATPPWAK